MLLAKITKKKTIFYFKNKYMKDNLQRYLENVCITQAWAKKQINKKIEYKDKINSLSISSVKQRLNLNVNHF